MKAFVLVNVEAGRSLEVVPLLRFADPTGLAPCSSYRIPGSQNTAGAVERGIPGFIALDGAPMVLDFQRTTRVSPRHMV